MHQSKKPTYEELEKRIQNLEESEHKFKQTKELIESEATYRHLYETMTQGVVFQGADGKIIEANHAASELLGLTLDQMLGKTAYDPRWKTIHQDGSPYDPAEMPSNIALQTGKPSKNAHCGIYIPEKGYYRWILIDSVPRFKDGETKPFATTTSFIDINERKKIEAGLEKTRIELEVIKKSADDAHEFADSVINTVREPLISLDHDLRVVTVSRSFYDFFKVKPEETVGQLIYDLGNKQWDIPKLRELLENILPEKTAFDNYEVEHDFDTIGRRTMLLNARQIEQAMGKERIILLAIEDITEQKRSQDKIKASLAEKETLLKEVHHRVKNNMQVISSLLRMQARKIKDEDFAEILMDSQNRIKSMALVYNKLYQSENLDQINMADYIKDLITGLIRAYSVKSQRITSRVEQSNVLLGVDIAIPCGIIINELITNCIKYAFPKNRPGEITVSIRESGHHDLELLVSDNGVGLPESFSLTANTKTLGLKLVTNLIENQLDGKIEFDRSKGTTFKIIFGRVRGEE